MPALDMVSSCRPSVFSVSWRLDHVCFFPGRTMRLPKASSPWQRAALPSSAFACYAKRMLSSAEILGPSGRIAARLPNYEHRDEQLAMADAVAHAIENRHHLVVEAGTGVGKELRLSRARRFAHGRKARRAATMTTTRLVGEWSSPRTPSASRSNCWPRTCRCCGA